MPQCCHIFHEECCATWLDRKFTCPNCNLPINMGQRPQLDYDAEDLHEAAPAVVPAVEINRE